MPRPRSKIDPMLLSIWEAALYSEDGIAVSSEKPDELIRKLYLSRKAQKDLGDERFAELRICHSPDGSAGDSADIWIIPDRHSHSGMPRLGIGTGVNKSKPKVPVKELATLELEDLFDGSDE